MDPKNLQSTTPPAGMGRARLLKFQTTQKLYYESIKQMVSSDRATISTSESAIKEIEQGIQQAQTAVATYTANLDATRESIKRIKSLQITKLTSESLSTEHGYRDILRRLTSLADSGSLRELSTLQTQKEELKMLISLMESMVSSLKWDLSDWRVELSLSQQSFLTYLKPKKETKKRLEVIKALLLPVKLVPPEIWVSIFRLAHDQSSLSQATGSSSIAMSVSQVCRDWRFIALDCPHIWNRITISPVPWWPKLMKDNVSQNVSRSHGNHVELLVPLYKEREWDSQALASGKIGAIYIHSDHSYRDPAYILSPADLVGSRTPLNRIPGQQYVSSLGQLRYKPTYQEGYTGLSRHDLVPISSELIYQPYTAHIYADAKTKLDENRLSSIPFKKAGSIIIEGLNPHITDLLGRILSPFGCLERLVLVDVWPSVADTMTPFIKGLTYLQIKIKSLVAFNIAPLLCSTLEELDIQHENATTFLPLRVPIALPKLKRLSITSHEHPIWLILGFPVLQELAFHASAPPSEPEPTFRVPEDHQLRKLSTVSFYNWSDASNPTPLEVLDNFTGTQELKVEISNCIINSVVLNSIVENNPRIKTVTIACCTGITQAECEILKGKVEKINVYI